MLARKQLSHINLCQPESWIHSEMIVGSSKATPGNCNAEQDEVDFSKRKST